MSSDSNPSRPRRKAVSDRPPKPYPDFPLCPHASGAWQKKIRGKVCYFGKWGRRVNGKMERLPDDGWQAALEQYKEQKDDLYAGRSPQVKGGGLTVMDLCNRFLTAKSRKLEAGELTVGAVREYKLTTDRLMTTFGKNRQVDNLAAGDFEGLRAELAKAFGPVRLGNEIQKVRTVFKFGFESGLMERPVRSGPDFKKPAASVIRKHRAANGEKMFEAAEITKLLKAATPAWKAMILLGVNCGLGNTDCATLAERHLDLDGAWLNYPRPKTGIARRCTLWPETVAQLRAALSGRPKRDEASAGLVFLNSYGRPWSQDGTLDAETLKASAPLNSIARGFRKLLDATGLHRKGIGFYTLRHVFRTVADGCGDQVAVNHVMGHVDPSMGAAYRERIGDDRLRHVADHVHAWLYPPAADNDNSKQSKRKRAGKTRDPKPAKAVKRSKATSAAATEGPRLRLFAG